jgi:hypothetical protein
MGAFFILFLAYLIFLQTRSDITQNTVLRGISDLFVLTGAVIGAVTSLYVALFKVRKAHQTSPGVMTGRGWIAWTFIGAAITSYAIGQAIWTWYDFSVPSELLPYPAAYDIFYILVYPLSWVGVALLIPRSSSGAQRTRLLIDAGIAVASIVAISWYFVLGPRIAVLSGSLNAKIVSLAYPIGDLSLCIAAALLLFGISGGHTLRSSIRWLTIGVTWLAITDFLYGYLQMVGTYHTGLIQDIGWPMSWLFLALAAYEYTRDLASLTGQRVEDASTSGRLSTVSAVSRAIAPTLLAVLTCALLIFGVAIPGNAPFVQVFIVCAALLLFPLVRQILTIIDNMLLNERLRTALDQSQQAFQQSQQDLLNTSMRAEQYEELRAGIENIQAVHAQLAKGDLSTRAEAEGPLAPVAHSLNLLIERMNRWAQYAQVNKTLEQEATLLNRVLENLSEGNVTVSLPTARSGRSTGHALLAVMRLQNRLTMRFGRLRDLADLAQKNCLMTAEVIQRLKQVLQSGSFSREQAIALQEGVQLFERRLANMQQLMQELRQQVDLYHQPSHPDGVEGRLIGGR